MLDGKFWGERITIGFTIWIVDLTTAGGMVSNRYITTNIHMQINYSVMDLWSSYTFSLAYRPTPYIHYRDCNADLEIKGIRLGSNIESYLGNNIEA